MTIETEAQMRARHAKELRDNRAEQKRIEQRDDRDEKHLAKWLRKRHYSPTCATRISRPAARRLVRGSRSIGLSPM